MNIITRVHAREILDSRGKPTVEAEVALQDGARTPALREYAAGLALHLDGDPLDICVSDGEGGCVTDGDVVNSPPRP